MLQEEILSPNLFSFLISDIEKFLRAKGCRGIPVNHSQDILILAYADDIVFLTVSPRMLLKVLKHLREYCMQKYLNVNEQKSEIIIFRKGEHKLSKNIPDFYYVSKKLNVVNEYCYLGVTFSKTNNYNV